MNEELKQVLEEFKYNTELKRKMLEMLREEQEIKDKMREHRSEV